MGRKAAIYPARRLVAGRCSQAFGPSMPTVALPACECYATADLGNIAYESAAMEGMIVDEGVIVEIVIPGTGIPVPRGGSR